MECCGWIRRLARKTSQSEVNLTDLPPELAEHIFRHLTATDLCHVALCNQILREAANQDALWRPLCRKKGWERYGTTCDLSIKPPFKPTSQEQKAGVGGAPTFPADAVVTGPDWPGLVNTCKWKEVYIKSRHLEENKINQRCYAMSLELCSSDAREARDYGVKLVNTAGEGDCLAAGLNIDVLQIWDLSSGECQHVIRVDVSSYPDALKMKGSIIAVGCKDGKIRTYSALTGEQLQVMSGHCRVVSHIFFDGDTIVSDARPPFWHWTMPHLHKYEESDIRVWSAASGSTRCILQSGHEATRLIDIDYKDKIVAAAYSDNNIRVWYSCNGSYMQEIVCGVKELTSCHLEDGVVIATSKDPTVNIWDVRSGECIKTFDVRVRPIHMGEVRQVSDNEVVKVVLLSDGLLVVGVYRHGYNVVNLNGERLLTYVFGDMMYPVRLIGNTLLTYGHYRNAKGYVLRIIDRMERADGKAQDSSETKASQYLGRTTEECSYMSDTIVAFPRKHMYPTIDDVFVRHYW